MLAIEEQFLELYRGLRQYTHAKPKKWMQGWHLYYHHLVERLGSNANKFRCSIHRSLTISPFFLPIVFGQGLAISWKSVTIRHSQRGHIWFSQTRWLSTTTGRGMSQQGSWKAGVDSFLGWRCSRGPTLFAFFPLTSLCMLADVAEHEPTLLVENRKFQRFIRIYWEIKISPTYLFFSDGIWNPKHPIRSGGVWILGNANVAGKIAAFPLNIVHSMGK